MKFLKSTAVLVLIAFVLIAAAGCGVSKNKYETLLNEKLALEEKLNILTKSRDALRGEYENILKEKMDIASKLETAINEKNALKSEYDKLLDEKVTLKAAYEKITEQEAKGKAPQAKAGQAR